ncbi:MAG: S-layer homology domain-containing protein, partial [Butyricicoccus sp.]|nr:S-layer homology domain-containing protein [Butyricicoccus sp.]
VLAFAMAFTMMATAGAAYTDQADIQATEAVEMLATLGVMTGDPDGSFRPNDTITRAEACRMIYSIRTGSDNADAYAGMQTTFTDVPSDAWYAGYVKHCQSVGIVSGKSATIFDPNANVTGVELALMCLRVMGYDPAKADIGGSTWSTKTIGYATEAGILDDVNTSITADCPRQWAAQLMYNMIQAHTVRWSNDSETYTDLNMAGTKYNETVGLKYLDLWINIGTLTNINADNLTITMNQNDNLESDKQLSSAPGTLPFSKLSKDYTDLLGQKVKVLFKDGKTNSVIGVYATEENTVYSTVMNAVEEDNGKIKFDGNSYSVDSAIELYINGTSVAKNKTAADFDNDAGDKVHSATRNIENRISADEVKFIDSDDNGKIDTAMLTTVDVAKVTYVSSDEILAGGTSYKYADENIAEGIAKDEYVAIREDLFGDCKSVSKIDYLNNVSLSGTKTNPNQYLIDGTWYKEGVNAEMNSVQSGTTVNAYAVNGVVFYAKRASGENATLSDVAIVLAVGTDIQGDKAKILKLDGTTTEIVDIDNDPGTGYVAKGALEEGAVYEYSVKGGEYRFKNLDQTKDYFGDYTALNDGAPSGTGASNTISGLTVAGAAGDTKSVGGTAVADSAKVILIDDYAANTADYKIITGKQFKSLTVGTATENVYSDGGIAAFTSKVDGVTRVSYAVVAVNNIADSFVTNDNYGYVTEDSYKADGGYVVYTIWNGSESLKVQEKGNTARSKGKVLGYSSITTEEGLADGVVGTIEDVDDNFGLVDNGIVYGVNDSQTKISLDGKNQNEITSDTKVLYVDTKDHIGYADGDIQEADDFGTGKIANVMYLLDGSAVDADVSLLIVDVKNNLHGSFAYNFGAGATAADINQALTKGDVTINGALDAMTLNVPENTTLTIAVDQTKAVDVNVADGATVFVKNDIDLADTTVTVAAGGQLKTDVATNSSEILVGPKNARIVTASKTEVTVDFKGSNNLADMTIAGDATIPAGQTWYSMFGKEADNATGLAMKLTSGKLTVNGTLKLISGANGSSLTVSGTGAVVVGSNGMIEVAKAADVTGNNAITGTDDTSKLIVKSGNQNVGTITGIAGVTDHTEKTYTWDADTSAWK